MAETLFLLLKKVGLTLSLKPLNGLLVKLGLPAGVLSSIILAAFRVILCFGETDHISYMTDMGNPGPNPAGDQPVPPMKGSSPGMPDASSSGADKAHSCEEKAEGSGAAPSEQVDMGKRPLEMEGDGGGGRGKAPRLSAPSGASDSFPSLESIEPLPTLSGEGESMDPHKRTGAAPSEQLERGKRPLEMDRKEPHPPQNTGVEAVGLQANQPSPPSSSFFRGLSAYEASLGLERGEEVHGPGQQAPGPEDEPQEGDPQPPIAYTLGQVKEKLSKFLSNYGRKRRCQKFVERQENELGLTNASPAKLKKIVDEIDDIGKDRGRNSGENAAAELWLRVHKWEEEQEER